MNWIPLKVISVMVLEITVVPDSPNVAVAEVVIGNDYSCPNWPLCSNSPRQGLKARFGPGPLKRRAKG